MAIRHKVRRPPVLNRRCQMEEKEQKRSLFQCAGQQKTPDPHSALKCAVFQQRTLDALTYFQNASRRPA
jgi:hypothetical protein